MQMRTFGRTGLQVSALGFGCGAVGGIMVRGDPGDQERLVARALEIGVNYFDTAVLYGDGASESNLGRVLRVLKPAHAIVGTKVRVPPGEPIAVAIAKSLEGSLARLQLDHVDIFHLHNPITTGGGGSSLSVQQVLGRGGAGVRAPAPAGQDPLPRHFRRRRHRGAAPGGRCRCLRQRAGGLQHAQSLRG